MKADALRHCLLLQRAQASLQRKLDDELGTQHGLSFADFGLLTLLAEAGAEGLRAADLTRPMGVQASTLLRQVIALEKTGWLERVRDAAGTRRIALRGPGRQLVAEARITAAALCTAALACVPAERLASCDTVLEGLCASAALEVD